MQYTVIYQHTMMGNLKVIVPDLGDIVSSFQSETKYANQSAPLLPRVIDA